MSKRPEFTIAHITEQFDVSRSTVRRGLTNGRFPNAKKDHHGRWVIPVDDVLQAGITPRKTWLNDPVHEPHSGETHEPGQSAQTDVDANDNKGFMNQSHLEKELAHERAQVDKLKALLDAERAHVESLRMALRMIETRETRAPITQPESQNVPSQSETNEAKRTPGLVQRIFGWGKAR